MMQKTLKQEGSNIYILITKQRALTTGKLKFYMISRNYNSILLQTSNVKHGLEIELYTFTQRFSQPITSAVSS